MIYDAVEHATTVAGNNFGTDMAAIATAKSEGSVETSVTVHDRLDATEFHGDVSSTNPGLGIYASSAATQAKHPDIRESAVALFFDYYAIGADATVLGKQVELAVEATLQTIDRMQGGADGITNVGGAEGSVTVTLLPISRIKGGQAVYEGRCIVQTPVNERDTGL